MRRLLVSTRLSLALRDKGATAVEYSLLVALIAGVIVVAVVVLGGSVSNAFQSASVQL